MQYLSFLLFSNILSSQNGFQFSVQLLLFCAELFVQPVNVALLVLLCVQLMLNEIRCDSIFVREFAYQFRLLYQMSVQVLQHFRMRPQLLHDRVQLLRH